jgi:hypothetical protein
LKKIASDDRSAAVASERGRRKGAGKVAAYGSGWVLPTDQMLALRLFCQVIFLQRNPRRPQDSLSPL